MRRGLFNTMMGMACLGFGAGLLASAFDWSWGAQIGLVLLGVPFVMFMFGKERDDG